MSRVHGAIALGALLFVIALTLTLLHSPNVRARTNSLRYEQNAEPVLGTFCQGGETLPRETSAIRLYLKALVGPRVTLAASENGRVIAEGQAPAGWTGTSVTIPLRSTTTSAAAGVTICSTVADPGVEALVGYPTGPATAAVEAGHKLPGRAKIDFLTRSRETWLELIPSVIRRIGLGRAGSGSWIVGLLLLLMCAVVGISLRLISRELG